LDDYPVAARVIKDLFQLSPQAVAPTLASYAPGNLMLHHPAKADKESKAKKGIVKLMLLHIRGDNDIKATLVSNIIPAIPSKGMEVVLNQPHAAQAIHRPRANDIRVGQATRLHQHPFNSDIDLGYGEEPCVPYASRELCN
jgi:hypothetical protein